MLTLGRLARDPETTVSHGEAIPSSQDGVVEKGQAGQEVGSKEARFEDREITHYRDSWEEGLVKSQAFLPLFIYIYFSTGFLGWKPQTLVPGNLRNTWIGQT